MSLAATLECLESTGPVLKNRRAVSGTKPLILTDIYEDDVNIVTWQRDLSSPVQQAVSQLLTASPTFQASMTASPDSVRDSIGEALGSDDYKPLAENIAELVDMFCYLFNLSRAGLRLTALDRAMCPRFHVDRVPCRLVTTYHGIATEWLPHLAVNRSKLGAGSNGLPDHESGLYAHPQDVQQLRCGDVGLLKGENWFDNENAGLVHRSPAVAEGECRLLFTLDFSD